MSTTLFTALYCTITALSLALFPLFPKDFAFSNHVGYNTTSLKDRIYTVVGSSFLSVGDTEGEFTFSDLKLSGDYTNDDILYVINPDDCGNDMEVIYRGDDKGWYNKLESDVAAKGYVNDESFALGSSFLTSFSAEAINLVSAGQVEDSNIGYSVACLGKIYQTVVNATAREITWSEMSLDGDYTNDDIVYVINPDDCGNDMEVIYRGDDKGWYNKLESDVAAKGYVNDEPIAPGQGFMTSFSGEDISINFPPTLVSAE